MNLIFTLFFLIICHKKFELNILFTIGLQDKHKNITIELRQLTKGNDQIKKK